MRLNGIQCDNCTKFMALDEGYPEHWTSRIPDGWFTFFGPTRPKDAGDARHFCSPRCLAEYAGKLAPSPYEVSPLTGDVIRSVADREE